MSEPLNDEDVEMVDHCLLHRNPDDLAAVDLAGEWRWRELDRRVYALTRDLAAAGMEGRLSLCAHLMAPMPTPP